MIWLELRANSRTYDPGWNFTESVWAPTKKVNGSNWPFWNLVNQVVAGDIIFHLREINRDKVFTGYSIALTDGYTTQEKPTHDTHEWDFIDSYYRVDLNDYQPFAKPINLSDYFLKNNKILRDFFTKNKLDTASKQRLFYVIQRNKLQCLNGAYFSELGQQLSRLIIGINQIENQDSSITNQVSEPIISTYTNTGIAYSTLTRRIGHQQFSDNVKANFNYKCCYPTCEVQGSSFLVGGHIARWADNEELRGHTSNGLCLCLMHDKAFEKGLFTLDASLKTNVLINSDDSSEWLISLLENGHNLEIKHHQVSPSIKALRLHWKRIGFKPN